MTLCIHGLGYIGLTTASLFANNGHEVRGYDIDPSVRDRIRRGKPDVTESDLQEYINRALDQDLEVTDAPVQADVHIICVPTPWDYDSNQSDLSCVINAGQSVSSLLGKGDLVVLESTVPPGTTRGTLAPILAGSGFEPGSDIGVAYVPETVMPGNTVAELSSNDRIFGGINAESTAAVRSLYEPVSGGEVHVAPDATTAEFVKLAQNAFRDVNIAFANTLALAASDHDVDVRETIQLANSHPRVDVLDPGPGVGGHCIPVDPLFLAETTDEADLIEAARSINDRMPQYVVSLLKRRLGDLANRRIAVLGIAYKGNVSDTRNSPGLAIRRHLLKESETSLARADGGRGNADVRLCDPHVTTDQADLVTLTEALNGADAAIITAAHDEFTDLSPERIGGLLSKRLVVDALGVLETKRWERHGFEVVVL